MIILNYSGWVSCRLATNPDPYDDPRGTRSSFKQFAYAGEPDLDRVIRFQNPSHVRPYTHTIGVNVDKVTILGEERDNHPLIGARLDLIDSPVFEGRNVVIANDAREPIFPFHLSLATDDFEIRRKKSPLQADYPFPEYLPYAFGFYENLQQVGLPDVFLGISHAESYRDRLTHLEADLSSASENDKPGIEERISVLKTQQGNSSNFQFAMAWRLELADEPELVSGTLDGTGIDIADTTPWTMNFWFGAHDQDAQSFYCVGSINLPLIV